MHWPQHNISMIDMPMMETIQMDLLELAGQSWEYMIWGGAYHSLFSSLASRALL